MKKLTVLGVTVLSLAMLTACGSKSNESSETTKKDVVEKSSEKVVEKSSEKEVTKPSSSEATVDFNNAADFEAALNAGQDTTGKVVTFTADEIVPDGALGYTIWAGEHLNFISTEVLGWKAGETHTVKVVKVLSSMGSFMITFEVIK